MSPAAASSLLFAYLWLRLVQQLVETLLAVQNRRHVLDPGRLAAAAQALAVPDEEMAKAVAYSGDRYRFGLLSGWIEVVVTLVFVGASGLGLVDGWARSAAAAAEQGTHANGLVFFALLG